MCKDRFFTWAPVLGAVLFFGLPVFQRETYGDLAPGPTLVGVLCLLLFATVITLVREGREVLTSSTLRRIVGCMLLVTMSMRGLGALLEVVFAKTPEPDGELSALAAMFPPEPNPWGWILTLVVSVPVWAFVGTWATLVLLRLARASYRPGLFVECLRSTRSRWLRGFGAYLLGAGVALVGGTALSLLLRLVRPGELGALASVCAVIALFAISWNLMTATLLFDAVGTDRRFVDVVRGMAARSWLVCRECWWLVIVQALLVGLVVVLPVGMNVNTRWLGGYSSDAGWYETACQRGRAPESPLLFALLMAASLVLSIAIKLRIAKALARTSSASVSTVRRSSAELPA